MVPTEFFADLNPEFAICKMQALPENYYSWMLDFTVMGQLGLGVGYFCFDILSKFSKMPA